MLWQLWIALYNPRQTHHTFLHQPAPTTKKITMFSFIFYSFRLPPRLIFKYTLNDTANNRENLIHAYQASSFGTNHPTSTHFEFQPQNNPSALNNNLKIIVNNFLTCSTTRRKMPLRRHQTFNLATNPDACLLYFLVQPAPAYISSIISITTTTTQSLWLVLLMVQPTSLLFHWSWWKRLRFYDVSSTALPWHSKVWRFAIAHCLNLLERDLVQHSLFIHSLQISYSCHLTMYFLIVN